MTPVDWLVIIAYLSGMIGLSVYLGRRQKTQADYYLGGRTLPWWAIGLSTMATQTSAISFISIPAFVALKNGGGLTWLQYELAVPLAVIVTMVFLVPFFRQLKLISVYEYLERRYSPAVRYLVSLIFLLSRGLGTGVGVYASAIVLSVCFGISLEITILIIGGVTVIYDTIGGMKAVVYSDVIQMVILVAGVVLCIAYAAEASGGLAEMLKSFPAERGAAVQAAHGINDGGTAPFWAFLIGGIFLYTSYYGADQSQVQRELSAPSEKESRLSLVFNGFARFPLTLLYVGLGMALWSAHDVSPELAARVPDHRPDELVPQFILHFLPPGVRALIFASLMAAAMSSLDSALNSLSAVTVKDFISRRVHDSRRLLILGRLTTVGWGVLITGAAFWAGSISGTVIEAINKVGSAFYGPILAAFLVGVISKRARPAGVIAGLAVGVAFNLWLWIAHPGVHWMWWNFTGVAVTSLVSLAHGFIKPLASSAVAKYTLAGSGHFKKERPWLWLYGLLIAYFILLLVIVHAL